MANYLDIYIYIYIFFFFGGGGVLSYVMSYTPPLQELKKVL